MQTKNKIIEVVVGIIRNENKEILIAKRQKDQFMPNYWELPGGKIEVGEDSFSALSRELYEEIGITVKDCSLIYKICHHYSNKTVNLSIYNIEDSLGDPLGKEGQEIAWSSIEKFNNYKLLPTMWKIIHKISLPKSYWITPDEHQTESTIDECRKHLISGTKLIQLRSKTILDNAYIENIYKLCKEYKAKLVLNTPSKTYREICDGWHLTSSELLSLKERPCDDNKLLGASTHNKLETTHAEKISADYISLSPVEATLSHPDAKTLGWDRSSNIIDQCNLPLFLLGGMNKELVGKALSIGAQGVAGIREI